MYISVEQVSYVSMLEHDRIVADLRQQIENMRDGSMTRRCLVCGEQEPNVPGPRDPRWHVCVKHRSETKATNVLEYSAELRNKISSLQSLVNILQEVKA